MQFPLPHIFSPVGSAHLSTISYECLCTEFKRTSQSSGICQRALLSLYDLQIGTLTIFEVKEKNDVDNQTLTGRYFRVVDDYTTPDLIIAIQNCENPTFKDFR